MHRLGVKAAAIVLEDQPTFVARWQSERVVARAAAPVFAVNAACVVPSAVLGDTIHGRTVFLRRHEPERTGWMETEEAVPEVPAYAGSLPFLPDALDACDLDAQVAGLAIDHTVPVSAMHPAGRGAAEDRLRRLVTEVLPFYASARNDATRSDGASRLSPYLHFGALGPREVMASVAGAQAGGQHKGKFADEMLGWREWFHFQARGLDAPERYNRVADWTVETLSRYASDPRPELETLDALLHGKTRDETWNAFQKQFLLDGWMHNNLRMYWGKRINAMTPSRRCLRRALQESSEGANVADIIVLGTRSHRAHRHVVEHALTQRGSGCFGRWSCHWEFLSLKELHRLPPLPQGQTSAPLRYLTDATTAAQRLRALGHAAIGHAEFMLALRSAPVAVERRS